MYCPNCGQQQASEEMRFCSRCGFPLGLVSELLAHGGFLPQLADIYKSKSLLTRRNGVLFSIFWAMLFLFILTPISGIGGEDELAAIFAVVGLFGGLMWAIVALVLLKREPKELPASMNELSNAGGNRFAETNQRVLPPNQTQSAESYIPPAGVWKAPNTADFAVPRSVTEGTTKLLQEEEK